MSVFVYLSDQPVFVISCLDAAIHLVDNMSTVCAHMSKFTPYFQFPICHWGSHAGSVAMCNLVLEPVGSSTCSCRDFVFGQFPVPMVTQQTLPLLGRADRIGEAKNPGPPNKATCLLNFMIVNPTS